MASDPDDDVRLVERARAGSREAAGALVNCQDVRILRRYVVAALVAPGPGAGYSIAGVVPEGFRSVRQAPRRAVVRNNVLLVHGARGPRPRWSPARRAGGPTRSASAARGPPCPGAREFRIGLLERPSRPGDPLPARLRRQIGRR